MSNRGVSSNLHRLSYGCRSIVRYLGSIKRSLTLNQNTGVTRYIIGYQVVITLLIIKAADDSSAPTCILRYRSSYLSIEFNIAFLQRQCSDSNTAFHNQRIIRCSSLNSRIRLSVQRYGRFRSVNDYLAGGRGGYIQFLRSIFTIPTGFCRIINGYVIRCFRQCYGYCNIPALIFGQ